MLEKLTFERAVLVTGGLLVFAIATRPAVDPDLWWHLRSGQWMIDHRAILRADPFSATRAGVTREPTDWLSQVGLYGAWTLGGLTAVALVAAAIATAGMALIVSACRGPILVRVAVGTVAAAASSVFWAARPQMVTFLFTAVVVAAVTRAVESPASEVRRLWWLVPLFALWSNLHLGWFYGLLVLGAVLVGEMAEGRRGRPALDRAGQRTLAAVAGAAVLAVMANPVGPRIWAVVVTQVRVGRAYIQENQPPKLTEAMSAPFFLLLAMVVILLILRRKEVRATDVCLLGVTCAVALTSVRTVPLFATVAAPVVCRLLTSQIAAWTATREARPARNDLTPSQAGAFNLALVALVALLVAGQTTIELGRNNVEERKATQAPVAATAWIEAAAPPGHLFNPFDWGGYLIWEAPDYPVWIDGRADLYTEALTSYGSLLSGDGWRSVFARDGIGVALVPTGSGLALAVAEDPAWQTGYQDDRATVLVRR